MAKGRASSQISFYERVWALVRRVPRGRVATYGQLARLLGSPAASRAVGYAMFNVEDPGVPWQRVINSRGEVSPGGTPGRAVLQLRLLRREGVLVAKDGRIDLERYLWSATPGVSRRRPPRTRRRRR